MEKGGAASRDIATKTHSHTHKNNSACNGRQATQNLNLTIEKYEDNLDPRALSNSFLLRTEKVWFFYCKF